MILVLRYNYSHDVLRSAHLLCSLALPACAAEEETRRTKSDEETEPRQTVFFNLDSTEQNKN